jgi:hypothetical protein
VLAQRFFLLPLTAKQTKLLLEKVLEYRADVLRWFAFALGLRPLFVD